MAGSDGLSFPRLTREPLLSSKVADLLLATIISHGLRPGDKLPSERELGAQFGVSRTVVREAVRTLAAKGVIDVRTGRGLQIAAVEASAVSESMSLFLRGAGLFDYGSVHEVRVMIETQVAAVAAARGTAADIEYLTEVCERMAAAGDDLEEASRADVEFHRAVALATGNPLYLIMLDSIGGLMLDVRRATLGVPGRRAKGIRAHQRILAQIAAHDPDGARDAMQEHLADSLRAWRRFGLVRDGAPR